MQLPLAHSKLATQETPSARGIDVQTVRPVPSSVHGAPRQQSDAETHTAPIGRQGPGPGSHRPLVLSQTPPGQQVPGPPEWQSSPDARHVAIGSMTHLPFAPPSSTSHSFEQHCTSTVQPEPSRRHSAPVHVPALHPSAQQSLARVHPAPAGAHCGRQTSVVEPAAGSHRPLQHSPRDVHAVPAALHVPAERTSHRRSGSSSSRSRSRRRRRGPGSSRTAPAPPAPTAARRAARTAAATRPLPRRPRPPVAPPATRVRPVLEARAPRAARQSVQDAPPGRRAAAGCASEASATSPSSRGEAPRRRPRATPRAALQRLPSRPSTPGPAAAFGAPGPNPLRSAATKRSAEAPGDGIGPCRSNRSSGRPP